MSETSEQTQVEEVKQTEESNIVRQAVQPEEPRQSERARTLTEKGREFHQEKVKGLSLRFDSIYELWKVLTKVAKKSVIKQDPSNILQEHIEGIQREESELNSVYDEYRKIDRPAHDMRLKLDRCASVTKIIIQNALSQIKQRRSLFGLTMALYLHLQPPVFYFLPLMVLKLIPIALVHPHPKFKKLLCTHTRVCTHTCCIEDYG